MTNPNALVERHGENVTLERVTSPSFDDLDELDEAASTIETVTIEMYVSDPSERDFVRAEARGAEISLKGTTDSSVDVKSDRTGRPDRIQRNGQWYKVGEVRDDRHPMVDIEKKTVILEPLPGR